MKVLYTLLILALTTGYSKAQEQSIQEVASCCSGKEARCTGSAYCTACTNCSRCKHCSNGGSCGVCSSSYRSSKSESGRTKSNPKIKSSSTNKAGSTRQFTLVDDSGSSYYLDEYIVNTSKLNLRSGPGTQYEVLEKIYRGEKLMLLAKYEVWAKVKVINTGTIGFVSLTYISEVE